MFKVTKHQPPAPPPVYTIEGLSVSEVAYILDGLAARREALLDGGRNALSTNYQALYNKISTALAEL